MLSRDIKKGLLVAVYERPRDPGIKKALELFSAVGNRIPSSSGRCESGLAHERGKRPRQSNPLDLA